MSLLVSLVLITAVPTIAVAKTTTPLLSTCMQWLTQKPKPTEAVAVANSVYRDLAQQLITDFPTSLLDNESTQEGKLLFPSNARILFQTSEEGTYRLARELQALRSIRPLIEVVDWLGHVHLQTKSTFTRSSSLNLLWGVPRNLPPSQAFWLAITQSPDRPELSFSLLLPPLSPELIARLQIVLNPQEVVRAGQHLVLKDMVLSRGSEDFLRLLISGLQDRYIH